MISTHGILGMARFKGAILFTLALFILKGSNKSPCHAVIGKRSTTGWNYEAELRLQSPSWLFPITTSTSSVRRSPSGPPLIPRACTSTTEGFEGKRTEIDAKQVELLISVHLSTVDMEDRCKLWKRFSAFHWCLRTQLRMRRFEIMHVYFIFFPIEQVWFSLLLRVH